MSDKMREEFETWALTHFINSKTMNPLQRSSEEADAYHFPVISTAWTAWQASREALVIELPAPAVTGGNCIRDHAIRDVLEAAGLKVKS